MKHGLGDREGSVRKAAAGMLGGWVDQGEGDMLEVRVSLSTILLTSVRSADDQFLSRLDVVNSQVAEDALLSVFTTRPETFDQTEFVGMPFILDIAD